MTTDQIAKTLALRACSIIEHAGLFMLVHPHGFEKQPRSKELLAKSRGGALTEAWLWLHPEGNARAGITTIQRVVAEDFGVPAVALVNHDKHEPIATARRIAMALSRELTLSAYPKIAAAFDRDAQSAIYAHESILAQCVTDRAFAARVGALRVACSAAMRPDEGDSL